MNEILNLVQVTLDNILSEQNIRIYWGRRVDDTDSNQTEYVIYNLEGDLADVSADGDVLYRRMTVSLQYYAKYNTMRTYTGRQQIMQRLDDLREGMRNAGFGCEGGWFEIGDVDEIGFATFRSEYNTPRSME